MMKQTLIISMCLVYVVVAASYFDVVQALYGSCDDIEKDFKFEKALREKCNKNLDEANKKVEEGEGIKRQLGDCKNDGNRLKIDIDKLKKDKEYAKGEAQEFEDMLIREQTECRRKDKRCKECEEQLQQSQNKLTECEDKLIECGGIESAQSKRHAEFLKGQINDIKKQRDSLEVELDDLKTTFRNIRLTETICQSNYTDLVRQLSECRNKEGSIVDNIGIQMEGGKEFMSGLAIQVILAVSAGAVFIIIFLIHGNNKNQSLEFKLRESEKDLEREKELKEQEIKLRQLEKEHFDETITKLTQGRILGRHPSERSHSPSPAPTVKSTPRQTVNQTRYGRDPDQNADRQVDHDSYGRDLSMLSADDEEEDEGRTSGYRKKRGEVVTSENGKPSTGLQKGYESAGKHNKGNGASFPDTDDSHSNTNKHGGNNGNMEEKTQGTFSSDKQGGDVDDDDARNGQSKQTPGPGQTIPSDKQGGDAGGDDARNKGSKPMQGPGERIPSSKEVPADKPDVGFGQMPPTQNSGPNNDDSPLTEINQSKDVKDKEVAQPVNNRSNSSKIDDPLEKDKEVDTSTNEGSMAKEAGESTGVGLPGEGDDHSAGVVGNVHGDSASAGGEVGKSVEGVTHGSKEDTSKIERPDGEGTTV